MTVQETHANHAADRPGDPITKRFAYQALIARLRELLPSLVPAGSRVLVVSRGDDELLSFDGIQASHYPQADDGRYAGYYPADGQTAIAHLEDLRRQGYNYILFPHPALWWLDHYQDLGQHLEENCRPLHRDPDCALFELDAPTGDSLWPNSLDMAREARWRQIANLLDAVLPHDASVMVVTADELVFPELGGRPVLHNVAVASGGKTLDANGRSLSFALRDAVRAGTRYVVVPASEDQTTVEPLISALRSRYPLILYQESLCAVFDTAPARRISIDRFRRSAPTSNVSSHDRARGHHGET